MMKYKISVPKRLPAYTRIPNIARNNLNARHLREDRRPALRRGAHKAVQNTDLLPVPRQPGREMRPNKSRAAGHD